MWKVNLLVLLLVATSSCSYSLTSLKNPWEKKGIKTVSVPIFKNDTIEAGSEVDFSNALRLYLTSRSGKLKYVTGDSDAHISGEVVSITLSPAGIQFGTAATEAAGGLPNERLLAVSYIVTVTVRLSLVRDKVFNKNNIGVIGKSKNNYKEGDVLWTNTFTQSQSMESGSYTDERRTSNVFIKDSAKKETIRELADKMMLFAVDSLLEEF